MPARYRNFDRYYAGMPRYREHRRLHPYFYNR
jgi:hypothetical protein